MSKKRAKSDEAAQFHIQVDELTEKGIAKRGGPQKFVGSGVPVSALFVPASVV